MSWLEVFEWVAPILGYMYLWGVVIYAFDIYPTTNKWTGPLLMIAFMASLGLVIAVLMWVGVL